MLRRIAQEGERPLAGLLETANHHGATQALFAQKSLSGGDRQSGSLSVDHPAVVWGDLLMDLLRRMGDEVAQLVHRTVLHRRSPPHRRQCCLQALASVDDDQLGRSQAARLQVLQQIAPGRLALSGQRRFQSQQLLLPVGSHAQGHQDRKRRAVAVEDQPHDRLALDAAAVRGVELPLHPASGATGGVLAHRPAKELSERQAHLAGLHPGQIRPRNRHARRTCHALVTRQQRAAKLMAATVFATQACPRHRQLHPAGRAGYCPWLVTMAIALGAPCASAPQPSERSGELQLLQNLARLAAHLLLQRIEPLASDEQIRRSHDTVLHGIVTPALVTPRLVSNSISETWPSSNLHRFLFATGSMFI